jgi:hypothetical protein
MLLISVPPRRRAAGPDAALTGNDIEDLVAIDLVAFVVDHNDPVAIAIQAIPRSAFCQHARLQGTNVRRPDLFVDVETIGSQPIAITFAPSSRKTFGAM